MAEVCLQDFNQLQNITTMIFNVLINRWPYSALQMEEKNRQLMERLDAVEKLGMFGNLIFLYFKKEYFL